MNVEILGGRNPSRPPNRGGGRGEVFIVLYLGAEYVILHNGDVDDFNVIIINHNKYIKEGTLKIRIYIL